MAAQIIEHRKRADGSFYLAVWTDTTQTLEDGTPDPAFVRTFEWAPRDPSVYSTQAKYVTMMLTEAKALLQAELAPPAADTVLSTEGATL